MIPIELAVLTNLTILILAAAFWLRSRLVWQRRVSMIESFALTQVLGRIGSHSEHIAQIAALKRQHRMEIDSYRSMIPVPKEDVSTTAPPSPRAPLPLGASNE